MNKQRHQRISKSLSYVLRHRPDSVGLQLGDGGWVPVVDLLDAFQRSGKSLTLGLLEVVVAENDKRRFEFSADRSLIRARQGHSAEVELGYEPTRPPDVLYHGTATTNLPSIFRHGLVKGRRHHVHMSTNKQTMIAVAKRHGRPALLAIDAKQMHADGHVFFVTGNDVWLTDHVPPAYLRMVAD
jgi:putative RNA 2'-phosphotransferase